MVHRSYRALGLPNRATGGTQPVKSLRRSDFVDQVQVDIKKVGLVFGLAQTSLVSLVGGNPKYAQWIAGIGGGLVLLSKAIDSANNAISPGAAAWTISRP